MAHFDDIIIPDDISFNTSMGPSTSTQVVHLASGFRKTNRLWAQHLRRFNLAWSPRVREDAATILDIFEALDGPADSFLIRDWNDWNTTAGKMKPGSETDITDTDQPLQNTADESVFGDGVTTTFQAIKQYTSGSASHTRTIKKLFSSSPAPVVAIDGTPQSTPADYSFDATTGIFTFTSAPGTGSSPTWGGAFYVPVAFVDDSLLFELINNKHARLTSVELMEVRL